MLVAASNQRPDRLIAKRHNAGFEGHRSSTGDFRIAGFR
jgi:hypothetical protein